MSDIVLKNESESSATPGVGDVALRVKGKRLKMKDDAGVEKDFAQAGDQATELSAATTDVIIGRASAGGGNLEEIPCTSAARTLIAAINQAAQQAILGLVPGTNIPPLVGGLIPIAYIPPAAIERVKVVANQAARFALTITDVQNGDTVKQDDTGHLFYVVDDTQLGSAAGYADYTAAVAWAAISGVPTAVSLLGGLTPAADKIGYFSGPGAASLADFTAAARTLLAASTQSAQRTAIGFDGLTYPLMNYGGMHFDGATNYLNANALTGIADGKSGSFCAIVRFANASSAVEVLLAASSSRFRIYRTAVGNIQVLAQNASGTQILSAATVTAPCASAGEYVIQMAWNLATGAFSLAINDVSIAIVPTYTNDNINYATATWAVGAFTTGGSYFSGDMYAVWFDATTYIDFSVASNRRKFIDPNLVPVFLGKRGELPLLGTMPTLFLGYDNSAAWYVSRGGLVSTSFTLNGSYATPTAPRYGQYGDPQQRQMVRVTTGSIGAGASAVVTVTWPVPFRDVNYTPQANVLDTTAAAASLRVVHVESQTNTAITVRVENTSSGALTGTVLAHAVHD